MKDDDKSTVDRETCLNQSNTKLFTKKGLGIINMKSAAGVYTILTLIIILRKYNFTWTGLLRTFFLNLLKDCDFIKERNEGFPTSTVACSHGMVHGGKIM